MQTIAIINQKGGVAKTITAINLAAGLGRRGFNTLLIDLDPQGSCSDVLANPIPPPEMDRLFIDPEKQITDLIQGSKSRLVDIVPANMDLAGIEPELFGMAERGKINPYNILQGKFNVLQDQYHITLIDTPPSLGIFTLNALSVADYYLVPVISGDMFAFRGLKALERAVENVRKNTNEKLRLLGYLITMTDRRTTASKTFIPRFRTAYGDLVLQTEICTNARLKLVGLERRTIYEIDSACGGARDYRQLTQEIIDWLKIHEPQEALNI